MGELSELESLHQELTKKGGNSRLLGGRLGEITVDTSEKEKAE